MMSFQAQPENVIDWLTSLLRPDHNNQIIYTNSIYRALKNDFGEDCPTFEELALILESNFPNNFFRFSGSQSLDCFWKDCHENFPDSGSLIKHVEAAHFGSDACEWLDCGKAAPNISHVLTHIASDKDNGFCRLSMQTPKKFVKMTELLFNCILCIKELMMIQEEFPYGVEDLCILATMNDTFLSHTAMAALSELL